MIRFAFLLMISCFAFLAPPASAKPGGGDEGVDLLPAFAAISLGDGLDAVTFDGVTWQLADDGLVADAVADASVTAIVDTGPSTLLLVGSMSGELETAVLASIATAPVSAPETHPKPSRDEYRLKKTIITSGGKEKDIFKTLVVEKRGGETGSEFQKRSERELRDAMDAGWESTP